MTQHHKKSSSVPATASQTPSDKWEVIFHEEFLPEFRAFDLDARRELAAFYKTLIKVADKRFDTHLKKLAKAKKESP